MGKVYVDTESVIERFQGFCYLLALGDRVRRHESRPNSRSLHQLCGFEIPAGNIVNFTRRFIELALFAHINGENILLLHLTLQRIAHKRRISYDVIQLMLGHNALPIQPQGVPFGNVGVGFQRQEV